MGKKLTIIFLIECVFKSQGIKVPRILLHIPLKLILVVLNVLTNSMPTHAFFIFDFVGKIKQFHAIIIKRVWFCHIYHIELYLLSSFISRDAEKEPLSMTIGINVIL
jgi:hypothetical protein